jgi:hypothetical protein
MKNILVTSCPDQKNYGNILQSFAIEHYLKDLGFEAKTIDRTGLRASIAKGKRSYYLHNFD